jgi:hypothetical protein
MYSFSLRNLMAMSAIDTNVRGISDLISAVHMSQSTHADMNLANHISSESEFICLCGGEFKILNVQETGTRNSGSSKRRPKFFRRHVRNQNPVHRFQLNKWKSYPSGRRRKQLTSLSISIFY